MGRRNRDAANEIADERERLVRAIQNYRKSVLATEGGSIQFGMLLESAERQLRELDARADASRHLPILHGHARPQNAGPLSEPLVGAPRHSSRPGTRIG